MAVQIVNLVRVCTVFLVKYPLWAARVAKKTTQKCGLFVPNQPACVAKSAFLGQTYLYWKPYQNWYLQYTSTGTSIDEYFAPVPRSLIERPTRLVLVLVPVLVLVLVPILVTKSVASLLRSQAGRVAKIWDQSCTCGFWFSVDFLPKTRYTAVHVQL